MVFFFLSKTYWGSFFRDFLSLQLLKNVWAAEVLMTSERPMMLPLAARQKKPIWPTVVRSDAASPSKARGKLSNRKASTGSTTQACGAPMAPWLLLLSFPWPPPPPPGSSSGRGGGGGGGDGGDWKPNVVAAVAGVHLGRSLRRRLAGLLCSPVLALSLSLQFTLLL